MTLAGDSQSERVLVLRDRATAAAIDGLSILALALILDCAREQPRRVTRGHRFGSCSRDCAPAVIPPERRHPVDEPRAEGSAGRAAGADGGHCRGTSTARRAARPEPLGRGAARPRIESPRTCASRRNVRSGTPRPLAPPLSRRGSRRARFCAARITARKPSNASRLITRDRRTTRSSHSFVSRGRVGERFSATQRRPSLRFHNSTSSSSVRHRVSRSRTKGHVASYP